MPADPPQRMIAGFATNRVWSHDGMHTEILVEVPGLLLWSDDDPQRVWMFSAEGARELLDGVTRALEVLDRRSARGAYGLEVSDGPTTTDHATPAEPDGAPGGV
jgi:hypothetical protein